MLFPKANVKCLVFIIIIIQMIRIPAFLVLLDNFAVFYIPGSIGSEGELPILPTLRVFSWNDIDSLFKKKTLNYFMNKIHLLGKFLRGFKEFNQPKR